MSRRTKKGNTTEKSLQELNPLIPEGWVQVANDERPRIPFVGDSNIPNSTIDNGFYKGAAPQVAPSTFSPTPNFSDRDQAHYDYVKQQNEARGQKNAFNAIAGGLDMGMQIPVLQPTQPQKTNVDDWLQADHKMTKDEKKEARQILADYDSKNINTNVGEHSQAEIDEAQKMGALRDKAYGREAILYGSQNAMPGVDALERLGDRQYYGWTNEDLRQEIANRKAYHLTPEQKEQVAVIDKQISELKTQLDKGSQATGDVAVDEAMGLLDSNTAIQSQNIKDRIENLEREKYIAILGKQFDDSYGYTARKENAQKQNPIEYMLGDAATRVVETALTQKALGNTGYGDALDSIFGDSIGGKIAADVAKDMPVDLLTDTLPEYLSNKASGMSGNELSAETLKNIAINLGINVGVSGLQSVGDLTTAIKSKLAERVAKGEIAEDAAKQVDELLDVNTLAKENASGVDDIVKAQEDAVSQIEDLSKQINEINLSQATDEATSTATEVLANGVDVSPELTAPKGVKGSSNFNVDELGQSVNATDQGYIDYLDSIAREAEDEIPSLSPQEIADAKPINDILVDEAKNADGAYKGRANSKNGKILDDVATKDYFGSDTTVNDELNKLVNQFGYEEDKEDLWALKDLINQYNSTGDEKFLREAQRMAQDFDTAYAGRKITTGFDETKKLSSTNKPREYTFGEQTSTFSNMVDEATRGRYAVNMPTTESTLKELGVSPEGAKTIKTEASVLGNVDATKEEVDAAYQNIIAEVRKEASQGNISVDEATQLMDNIQADREGVERVINGVSDSELRQAPEIPFVEENKVIADSTGIQDVPTLTGTLEPEYYSDDVARSMQPPTTQDTALSNMAVKTYPNSGITTEAERQARKYDEVMRYAVDHQDDTMSQAVSETTTDADKLNWEGAMSNLSVKQMTPTEVHKSMIVYEDLVTKARQAAEQGLEEEAEALWQRADNVAIKLQQISTASGKQINALKAWNKNTPEGAVIEAKRQMREKAVEKYGADFVDKVEQCTAQVNNALRKDIATGVWSKDELKETLNNILNDPKWASLKGKNKIIKLIDNYDASKQNINQLFADIEKEIKKVNGIGNVNANVTRQVYDLVDSAMKLDADSIEARRLVAQAGKLVADEIPASLGQMFKSITYSNMLGNFKTAISRNLAGNIGFNSIEGAVTKPIASLLDKATSLVTKQRSVPDVALNRLGASVRGTGKGIAEQAGDFKRGISTTRSGQKNTLENAIDLNRRSFTKTDIPVLKQASNAANRTSKVVTQGMEFGDRPVFETVYASQKQGYENLVAKLQKKYGNNWERHLAGFDPSSQTIEQFIDEKATKVAEQAVFQDEGLVAEALGGFKENISKYTKGLIGTDIASQPSMAFTKTPGNIIERAAEYTPLGFVKNAIETVSEIAGKGKSFNQQRFVTELSRSLTGLGIEAGTIALALNKLTTGGYSNKAAKKASQIANGQQEYALQIGDKQYDPSDIPVLGGYIQSSAKAAEKIQENMSAEDLNDADVLAEVLRSVFSLETAKDTVGAMTESSAMQGLNRLFGTNTTYSDDSGNIIDNAINTIKSSSTQFIPSLVRQTAQTTDTYKRDYGEYGTNEYYLNMAKSNIPGLRQTLNVKYDNEGNPVLQNQGRSLGEKIAENYFLPMAVSEYKPSRITQAADKIYDETGIATAYAPMENRSAVKEFCEKYGIDYSEDLYQQWKQERGTMNRELGEALLDDSMYEGLSGEQQAELFSKLYSVAGNMQKITTSNGDYSTDDKYTKMYMNGASMTDIIEEYKKSAAYKGADVSSSKALDEIYDNAYKSGGYEAAEQAVQSYADVQKYLKNELGMNTSSTGYKALIGAGSLEEAQKQYKSMVANGEITADGKKGTNASTSTGSISGLSNAKAIDVLESNSQMSDYDKGATLAKNITSPGGSAKDFASQGNWEDFYYYYMIKAKLDANGNGRLTKAERSNLIPVLEDMGFDETDIADIKKWDIK